MHIHHKFIKKKAGELAVLHNINWPILLITSQKPDVRLLWEKSYGTQDKKQNMRWMRAHFSHHSYQTNCTPTPFLALLPSHGACVCTCVCVCVTYPQATWSCATSSLAGGRLPLRQSECLVELLSCTFNKWNVHGSSVTTALWLCSFIFAFVIIITIIMCVPSEPFFVEGYDYLRTLDIGLSRWHQVRLITVSPASQREPKWTSLSQQ